MILRKRGLLTGSAPLQGEENVDCVLGAGVTGGDVGHQRTLQSQKKSVYFLN